MWHLATPQGLPAPLAFLTPSVPTETPMSTGMAPMAPLPLGMPSGQGPPSLPASWP